MQALTAGITEAGIDQTYVPKAVNEASFSWHATFPPGTFVPPHIHPTQDEYIYMFEGRFDLVLDSKEFVATAGDLIRLPIGVAQPQPTRRNPRYSTIAKSGHRFSEKIMLLSPTSDFPG